MTFPGGKRPFYPSSLAVLLIISLVHVWVSSQVGAIRTFPHVQEESQPPPPPPWKKNQTEIFREYFSGRVSDLKSSTTGTFLDDKRRIPSCPDPLHN
ncbi:hypothetical protein CDL12_05228 [Handroanthus impetiginosus]|uniref:Uncharacterized protein n=1 Tax=Handroanthus impetiginosus TaxID=429701 RepID=A0A2G9HX40_9LAMI|nr:hypothetical protein CDL12_05228 [Handroanthus impetiginosus]